MLTKRNLQTRILLIIAIVILVNILANRFSLRLDLTEDQRYSLSDATEQILESLEKPITITAYFSEELPPDVAKVRENFKDLLVEYNNLSDGKVVYEFVNPNEEQQKEVEAQQAGVRPVMINVRKRDQMSQQRAYLGAVIKMGDQKEVIPAMRPGAAMEYKLSSNIKKLSVTEKPKIALLQGHGEPKLSGLGQLQQSLSVMYDVEGYNFTDTTHIPAKYSTLMIIAPKDTINPKYFDYMDDFLARGGRILAAVNRVEGNMQNATGEKVNTNISDYLKEKGIEIEQKFLIDANCSNVMVTQNQGGFRMRTPVSFPYLPIISNFAEHPITEGLESVVLPFASPISIVPEDTSLTYIPFAKTSSKAGVQDLPLRFNVTKNWSSDDFGLSNIPIGVAVKGKIADDTPSRMVVFSDGDFATSGEGQNQRQLQGDNVSLMVNAVDWLSDDTGLIELRTKGVSSRPLTAQLDAGTQTFVKYLNFLLPILLIIIYGIFRAQLKRKLRNNLMSVDYGE